MAEENQQKTEQEQSRSRGRRIESQAVQQVRDYGQRGAELALGKGPHAVLDVAMHLNQFGKANTEALSQALSISTKGLLGAQEDTLRFAGMRLNKDMDHVRTLMSTRDLGEAISLQSDYMRDTLEDYVEQVQSLMEIGLRTTREGWTPIERRTEETSREMQRAAAE